MKTLGYDQSLYVLPFNHRDSFVTKLFAWHEPLTHAPSRRRRNGATLSAVCRNFRTRSFFMKQAASKQQRNP